MRFCQSLGFTCGLDTNVRGRLSKTSGFWPLLFFFIICFWFIVGRFLHHGPLAEGKLEVRVYLWIRD